MQHEYQVGDKAIIIREVCGHQYELGEIVKVIKLASHQDHFEVSNDKEEYYVSRKEIFPYEIIKNKLLEELRNEK